MHAFEYQDNQRFFAQVAAGFEAPAIEELEALGATHIDQAFRGLHFSATPAVLYGINYQSRLISRVLAPLRSFRCRDRDELYLAAGAIDWSMLLRLDQTFGVMANVNGNRNLTHSKYAALVVKDAIADAFQKQHGRRPDVDRRRPDLWFNLYLEKDQATISVDTSGGALHRRGYRRQVVEAPMQETLAAAIVRLSGWQGDRPLYDPMCGSGTLLCEALMHHCRIPAGYLRPAFGFQYLPDFDVALWRRIKGAADAKLKAIPEGRIAGSDIDDMAVRATRSNCRRLPGGKAILVVRSDFKGLSGLAGKVILCNPPYGLRMHKEQGLSLFYKRLGDFLKQRCKGSEAYIYFGNREMLKRIGLRPAWKKPLANAGLDGRLAKFELY